MPLIFLLKICILYEARHTTTDLYIIPSGNQKKNNCIIYRTTDNGRNPYNIQKQWNNRKIGIIYNDRKIINFV